jgi:hypothetical protein
MQDVLGEGREKFRRVAQFLEHDAQLMALGVGKTLEMARTLSRLAEAMIEHAFGKDRRRRFESDDAFGRVRAPVRAVAPASAVESAAQLIHETGKHRA